jgi:hypothetical protein
VLGKTGRCAQCGRAFDFARVSRWRAFAHAVICAFTFRPCVPGAEEKKEGQQ